MRVLAASAGVAVAMFAGAAAPSPHHAAFADPVITEKVTTYRVYGGTPKEVRADIDRKRKAAAGDGVFDAVNRWDARWDFKTVASEKGCAITDIEVVLDIEIVVPELGPGAPEAVRKGFDRYIRNLMVHEQGHSVYSKAAARQIDAAFRKLKPMPTCKALNAKANKLGHSLLKASRERDREYEKRTRHGAAQGATYP